MPKIPQNKKNKDYWDSRKKYEEDYIKNNLATDAQMNAELQNYYQRLLRDLEDEINRNLISYAKKEHISIQLAKERTKAEDIARFEELAKRVVAKAKRYRKEHGRYPGESIFTKEVNDKMRLYNAMLRINRLEAMKAQLGLEMLDLGLDVHDEIRNKLTDDYIQQTIRQAGIFGNHIMTADSVKRVAIAKTIMATSSWGNWSTSLWRSLDELRARMEVVLTKVVVEGKSYTAVSRELRDLLKKEVEHANYAAYRIVVTESARVQSKVTILNLKKYGYKYCKWIAEPSACKICHEIATRTTEYGEGVYPVDELPALPGETHPFCRCAISATWLDEV